MYLFVSIFPLCTLRIYANIQEFYMQNTKIPRKTEEKFAGKEKMTTFAIPFEQRHNKMVS